MDILVGVLFLIPLTSCIVELTWTLIQAHVPGSHLSKCIWWEPEMNRILCATDQPFQWLFQLIRLSVDYDRNSCALKSDRWMAQPPDWIAMTHTWGGNTYCPLLCKIARTFQSCTQRSIQVILGPGPKMRSSQEVQGVGTWKLWMKWEIRVWHAYSAPLGHFG